ncbi:MerR family transcriptional regulator [Parvularcula sp. IMCC14364]|uniref:MerR family transcriptional regulator n=1 Tax=Parvularcula sp. IMCC14364 TaxID=3067902 RepID=UPI002742916B|nr:MerR family transcriptional regulator [Parvularcula sp. IMCC14364]
MAKENEAARILARHMPTLDEQHELSGTPFDPTDYAFTVAEASKASGLSEGSIRNFLRRETLPVGKKNRLGRIMFSALDTVRLRVIGDLNKLLSVDPSSAAPVAEHVVNHCAAWMRRENSHLHSDENGYRKETRLIIHLDRETGTPVMAPYAWGESLLGMKVPDRGDEQDWARKPIVILPVEQIFGDVLEELFQILEAEQ